MSAANLIIHIIDPTVVEIDVVVEVVKFPEYEGAVVQANITAALDDYLSPQTWPWSRYLRYNELIALISNVDGVDYVSSMTTPSSNVDLGDSATLTTPDDYTITVV